MIVLLSGAAAGEPRPVRILAFGDSLVAGYGLPQAEGFTAQLEAALARAGIAAEVTNAGVSGDTTAGGRTRLDWALAEHPDLVLLALGGNDALRGLDPAATRANLDAMLGRLKALGIPVLLAGMKAPRNLGAQYTAAFDTVYPDLAARHGVALYPFFLDGVATEPALNQPDGIHPNPAGVRVMVQKLLPHLVPMLQRLEGASDG